MTRNRKGVLREEGILNVARLLSFSRLPGTEPVEPRLASAASRVTDEHFARATGAMLGAAQNPAQYAAVWSGKALQADLCLVAQTPDFPKGSTPYEMVQVRGMGGEGLEPPTSSV